MNEELRAALLAGFPHLAMSDRFDEGVAKVAALLSQPRQEDRLDVDALREAGRRVNLPREVTVADIENLAAEYGEVLAERPAAEELRRGRRNERYWSKR